MTANKLLDAIGMINDEAIRDAKEEKPTSTRAVSLRWIRPIAIAACFCIAFAMGVLGGDPTSGIVTGPGLLTVTAYALSPDEETDLLEECEMHEGVTLPDAYGWSLAISSRPGLPLKLSMPAEPDLSFDVSISDGQFLLWEPDEGVTAPGTKKITYLDASFRAENDTTLYWTNLVLSQDAQTGERDVDCYTGTQAYAEIVIRVGNEIVGYAVVKIYTVDPENAPVQSYRAVILKSVSFPKVNGRYQNVTEEYVAAEMERVIAEST